MNKRGLFIIVEGPDGTGKSTFIKELNKSLDQLHYSTLLTKETSSGPVGTLIRNNSFKGLLLAELQAADRIWHIENVILPALEKNEIVISDRFLPSSYVYQQIDGLDLQTIETLNQLKIQPDISIFLFADKTNIEKRLFERESIDRFETYEKRVMVEELYIKSIAYFKEQGYKKIYKFANNNEIELLKNIQKIINCVNELEN